MGYFHFPTRTFIFDPLTCVATPQATNGPSSSKRVADPECEGRHAKYSFSRRPDKALRQSTADFVDRGSEGDCRESVPHATQLQAEVLNQTMVAALVYLDFFLANVAAGDRPG